MVTTSGYSIWLVPNRDSDVFRVFQSHITEIAAECGTHAFIPHVTLLGGIYESEVVVHAKMQELVENLRPYQLSLGSVGSNWTHFQILFSTVEMTEIVLRANLLAQEIFGIDQESYFPHLSFAYGDIPREKVAIIANRLKSMRLMEGVTFDVVGLELWKCDGRVSDWRRQAVYPLRI